MIEWEEPPYSKEDEARDFFYDKNIEAIQEEVKQEMLEEGLDPEGVDEDEWLERSDRREQTKWENACADAADFEADRYLTYRYGYDY